MNRIEKVSVGVIKNEVVQEPLDDERWGFLTNPKFNDNSIELDIIFDLLVPIDESQHVYCKSGSRYILHGVSREAYINNIEPLLDLLQISMDHTRKMFIQRNPDHANIQITLFDKNYFIEELRRQFKEQGLV